MSVEERLILFLEKKYGITTREQLEKALAGLPSFDISIFVSPVPETAG